MANPTKLEKISYKLAKLIGSPFCLVLHIALFGGFFILRSLGIIPNAVLIMLATVVGLEAIFLIIFVQMSVKNNTKSLIQLQEKIDQIQQEEEEVHKLMVNILHLAHQMKTLKIAGNGHHGRRIHA